MIHFLKFLFSKTFIINLIIAGAILAGGLYGTIWYLDDYTLHGQVLEVPDLNGKYFDLLDSSLNKNEFIPILSDSIYLRGIPTGSIVDQDPKPGKTVKQGRKIYLTIASKQPPKVTMPDLVDLSLRQATSLMETYGLVVGELTYRPDLCANCILEQNYKGETLEAGDKVLGAAIIDLVVGQGLSNELTPVPYLIGMTKKLSSTMLVNSFINMGVAQFDESVLTAEDTLNAKVYKQMPFYSDEPSVQMGSSINIYLTMDTNKVIHTVNPSDSI
jgi:beta-lactam-binding protein with PASTA domain